MNNEYFAEMHKLIEKAKTYERIGREEEALKTYLEIHERFFPNTSDLFERPAILLEKRKQFNEAIEICEKAIRLIQEGKITGIKENFERRIARIKSRSDYTGPKVSPKKSTAFQWPKLKWRHKEKSKTTMKADIPKEAEPRERLRSVSAKKAEPLVHNEVIEKPIERNSESIIEKAIEPVKKPLEEKPVQLPVEPEMPIEEKLPEPAKEPKPPKVPKPPKAHFIRLKAYIRGLKNEANKFRKPTRNEMIALAVLVGFIGGGVYMINNKPQSKFEVMIDVSKIKDGEALEGSPFEKNLEDLPPITKTMIDTAVKETQTLVGVKQAGIIVQKDVVGFVIMTTPGTSKAQAKSASEAFVKSLSKAAAVENPELAGPGPVGYGELFDYYTLLVVAGENYDNLILKGSKNPKAMGIYWRDDAK